MRFKGKLLLLTVLTSSKIIVRTLLTAPSSGPMDLISPLTSSVATVPDGLVPLSTTASHMPIASYSVDGTHLPEFWFDYTSGNVFRLRKEPLLFAGQRSFVMSRRLFVFEISNEPSNIIGPFPTDRSSCCVNCF